MKRKIALNVLLAVVTTQPVYASASNPASTNYVDNLIQGLQTQITAVQNPTTYTIGERAQGGVIFYLDPSMQHGLASATADQSTAAAWDTTSGGSITSAALSGVYLGKQNTQTILTAITPSTNAQAATSCATYAGDGFLDWYLPSLVELTLAYLNKGVIGGFTNNSYWTSQEGAGASATTNANYFNFSSGLSTTIAKISVLYVRCIRQF